MKQCKCEHWQQCPVCMPHRFDAEGNVLPPEPTPLQAARDEVERLTAELDAEKEISAALTFDREQLRIELERQKDRDLAEHLAILAEQERVELGECRKDAERLDWLIASGARVLQEDDGFYLFWPASYRETQRQVSPRAAIDAAISEGDKHGLG